jgi:hypothetical protein
MVQDDRVVVQQALVDRAEFLHVQGRVVHPPLGVCLLVVVVDQVPEGLEEISVGDGPALEGERFEEAAVQHGEAQEGRQGLTVGLGHWRRIPQEVPEDPKPAPQVIVVRVSLPPVHEPLEAGDAVVFPVEVISAEKAPLFGHQQEKEPIHQPQKVSIELFRAHALGRGPMAQKSVGEEDQALFDPVPEAVPGAVALLHRLLVVTLEPARGCILDPLRKAGPVEEAVEKDEVDEALLFEDGLQVEGHVGLAA